jgi:hypothetical protein
MAFESIAEYVDQIEAGFGKHESPGAIARRLGIPEKAKTIARYKAAVWDLKDLVKDAKKKRAKNLEDKRDKAVDEIVDTLDLINLGKLRAKQLLAVNLGDEFAVSDGQKHKLTLGSASIYWPIGTKMMADSVKLEMELSGDDPESRKASALESLSDSEIDARIAELIERGKAGAEEPS